MVLLEGHRPKPTDRLGIDNSIAESHHLPRHRERWRLTDPFLEHVPYARPIQASYATIKWLVRRGNLKGMSAVLSFASQISGRFGPAEASDLEVNLSEACKASLSPQGRLSCGLCQNSRCRGLPLVEHLVDDATPRV